MTPFPTVGPDKDFLNRPDTLDFDILSALVIALDAEADEAGADFDLNAVVSRYVDPESLAYLAFQRAVRALRITTGKEVISRTEELVKLTSVYHDGFILGCRFQQTKGTKNAKSGDPRKRA